MIDNTRPLGAFPVLDMAEVIKDAPNPFRASKEVADLLWATGYRKQDVVIDEGDKRPDCCNEPGPFGSFCTDHPGHDYTHYDAGEDRSWGDDGREQVARIEGGADE